MPRCAGCVGTCSCVIEGDITECIAITTEGDGSIADPLLISADLLFDPDTDDCLNCGPQGVQLILDPNPSNVLSCGPSGLLALGGGGGVSPFVTVAASDTDPTLASSATYVCDGTADQVEIQQAFNDYPGNRIILLPGNFNTTTVVVIPASSSLIGSGRHVSIINYSGTGTAISVDSPGRVTVASLSIISTNAAGGCIYYENARLNCVVYDCYLTSLATNTTPAVRLVGALPQITNCEIVATRIALAVETTRGNVTSNRIGGAVTITNDDASIISDNSIETFNVNCNAVTMTDSFYCVVANNMSPRAGQCGIAIIGGGYHSILGNIFSGTSDSSSGTYDAILISTSSNENTVQGNVVFGADHRYAVRINDAGCTTNWITNNRLPTGLSGVISDLGTGTSTAAGNL